MKQHQYSDNIYDKTVNTIRLITLRDIHTHQFKVFFAVQRIGTAATIPVDNGSRGGLVAKIDLETGVLSEARCLHNKNVYKVHPDSGAPIEGAVIPNWGNHQGRNPGAGRSHALHALYRLGYPGNRRRQYLYYRS